MYLGLEIKLKNNNKAVDQINVMQKKELNKVLIYLGLPLWVIAIAFVALCFIINDLWFLN